MEILGKFGVLSFFLMLFYSTSLRALVEIAVFLIFLMTYAELVQVDIGLYSVITKLIVNFYREDARPRWRVLSNYISASMNSSWVLRRVKRHLRNFFIPKKELAESIYKVYKIKTNKVSFRKGERKVRTFQ